MGKLGAVSSVLFLVIVCRANAQTMLGYEITSPVKDYLALSTDVCTIVDAMTDAPYDFKLATDIYTKGKASGKKLKEVATTPRPGEAFFETYKAFFGSEKWNDDYIAAALAGTGRFASINEEGRAEAVKKGIQSGLMLFYMVHELDAAYLTIKTKSNADNQNEGAGHNVDEAFAVWLGESPGCSLYSVGERRANEFGTRSGCGSPGNVNKAMVQEFLKLKGAARAKDQAAWEAAYNEVIRLQYIVHAQSSLKYAIVLNKTIADGTSVDVMKGDQVEGYSFYRAIAPLVKEASAPASTALEAAWDIAVAPKGGIKEQVEGAFNLTYPAKRVSAADDISTYSLRFDCSANTLPETTQSLKDGATSKKAANGSAMQTVSVFGLLAAFLALMAGLL